MTLDLALAGGVLLLAVLGAISGAAKQIAHLVALVAAYAAARVAGTWLGPYAARTFDGPLIVGQVVATLATFAFVLVGLRLGLTYVFRKLMAGKNREDRSVDRGLGFALGGLKAAALIYVVVCALSFVEQNIAVAGQRLRLSPRDSVVFALARRFNVFELTRPRALEQLAALSRASTQGPGLPRESPALEALRKDPRVERLLESPEVRRAVERNDHAALLKIQGVSELLADPGFLARLAEAAQSLDP